MTYNVFSGTLNPTQSINQSTLATTLLQCLQSVSVLARLLTFQVITLHVQDNMLFDHLERALSQNKDDVVHLLVEKVEEARGLKSFVQSRLLQLYRNVSIYKSHKCILTAVNVCYYVIIILVVFVVVVVIDNKNNYKTKVELVSIMLCLHDAADCISGCTIGCIV